MAAPLPSDVHSPAVGQAKRSYVRAMFTAIAPRYDFLNHLLSFNVDRRWRRTAVARLGWEASPEGAYLDLCAGTMDLAADLAGRPGFRGRVIGADFVVPMLAGGRRKAVRAMPVGADAMALPFPDASFDGAMVGFGVRNLADLDAGLAEAARVLKPGARFVVLEFTTPRFAPLRAAYLLYFRRVLPAIGRAVSKHTDAYTYLPESVLAFPGPDELAVRLGAAGFHDVRYELLTVGVCAIHHGTR
jgi:demethylmenaquinone methyltransferase/2-methoxy-6-polyprenyl-1,4-benzoquinol methylase